MAHFPSESRKTLPSVESVPMDMVGLRRLVVSSQCVYNIFTALQEKCVLTWTLYTHFVPTRILKQYAFRLSVFNFWFLSMQKEGCYHATLELTGRFLSAHGQGLGQARQPSLHTHKTLQV